MRTRRNSRKIVTIAQVLIFKQHSSCPCLYCRVQTRLYFLLQYIYDRKCALIGRKPMFYQSIKHKKACFIVFATLPLYHKANEKYTVIKHSRHLRTLLKCRKHSPVLCSFPSCSQIPVVFYHSVIHGLGFFIC